MYKVKIEANNEVYSASGKTIEEDLGNMKITYVEIKTKGFATFQKDKMTIKKFFVFRQLRRLLVSNLFQRLWAQNMEKQFDLMKKKGITKKEMLEL